MKSCKLKSGSKKGKKKMKTKTKKTIGKLFQNPQIMNVI